MQPAARLPVPDPAFHRLLCIANGALPAPLTCDVVVALPAAELSAATLQDAAPDLVLLPLMSLEQDSVQLLALLSQLGYRGACVVVGPALPNPRAIEDELRAGAPGLQIRLVCARCPEVVQAVGVSRR